MTPDTMIMHFYQNSKETPQNFPLSNIASSSLEYSTNGWSELLLDKIPSMYQITCMEISQDNQAIFFIGMVAVDKMVGKAAIKSFDFGSFSNKKQQGF